MSETLIGSFKMRLRQIGLREFSKFYEDLASRGEYEHVVKALHATIDAMNHPRSDGAQFSEGWDGSGAQILSIVEDVIKYASKDTDFKHLEEALKRVHEDEEFEYAPEGVRKRLKVVEEQIGKSVKTAPKAPPPAPCPNGMRAFFTKIFKGE